MVLHQPVAKSQKSEAVLVCLSRMGRWLPYSETDEFARVADDAMFIGSPWTEEQPHRSIAAANREFEGVAYV